MTDASSETQALYQQTILDHNRRPRNCRPMTDATHTGQGHNPLCGDEYTMYLRVENGQIAEVSFVGSGCAISKAAASMMTTSVLNRTLAEAETLAARFDHLVTGCSASPLPAEDLGPLNAFAGVREHPLRAKCAVLPWRTMLAALRGEQGPVGA
jgi:nitrogen fixation protein NifU and related proteins